MGRLSYKYKSKNPLSKLKFKVDAGLLISEELILRIIVKSDTGDKENGTLNFSLESSGFFSYDNGSTLIEEDIQNLSGKEEKILKTRIIALDFDADNDDIANYNFSIDVVIHVTVMDSDGFTYSSRTDIGWYTWKPKLN